jgi:hypothetical protein
VHRRSHAIAQPQFLDASRSRAPYIPVACASSTITMAPLRSAIVHTSRKRVRSPSMLNTLSVTTIARPLRGF